MPARRTMYLEKEKPRGLKNTGDCRVRRLMMSFISQGLASLHRSLRFGERLSIARAHISQFSSQEVNLMTLSKLLGSG